MKPVMICACFLLALRLSAQTAGEMDAVLETSAVNGAQATRFTLGARASSRQGFRRGTFHGGRALGTEAALPVTVNGTAAETTPESPLDISVTF